MKKNYLTILLFISCLFAYSQKINEEFSTTLPPVGWSLSLNQGTLIAQVTTFNSYSRTGTAGAVLANNYSVSSGNRAMLETRVFTPSINGDSVRFDVAHAAYPAYTDSLIVHAYNGTIYNRIIGWGSSQTVNTTTGITTANAQTGGFTPTSAQWTTKAVALPAGTSKVRFEFYSDYGNQLYIDRVIVDSFFTAGMTYDSSNVYQATTAVVPRGGTNQQIISVKVSTTGNLSPLTVSSFLLGTGSSTNPLTDIDSAKIFFTGTSPNFATGNRFGAVASPNGTYSILGNAVLAPGNNYFWIAYDIKSTATSTNFVDADCYSVTVGGIGRTPSTTSPIGQRQILSPLSGTYNVGTGNSYTTLSGIMTDIGSIGLSGNTTILITSNITEPGNILIPQWNETGLGSYRLTIRPAVNATISANASSTAVIVLSGASRVTIDGRIGGTGNTNSLTLLNTSIDPIQAGILLNSLGASNGCNNDTIRNLNIKLGNNFQTSTLLTGIQAQGDNNLNLKILNNNISRAWIGINVFTTTFPAGANTDLVINGNEIGSSLAADYVVKNGIIIANSPSAIVKANYIRNIIDQSTNSTTGIAINANCFKSNISNNRIDSIQNVNNGGWAAYGINVNSATNNDSLIFTNNQISGISMYDWSATSTTWNPFGLRITGGNGHKIYYNTINLYGSSLGISSGVLSSCILSIGGTGFDMRNNILSNSFVGSTGSNSYCVFTSTANPFVNINYNNYYSSGSFGVLGSINSTVYNTLTLWRFATGQDNFSKVRPITYMAVNNLHLTGTSIGDTALIATPINTFNTDFDGENRDPFKPYMGCDELPFAPLPVKLVNFEAHKSGANSTISWVTSSEINNSHFIIERSIDGKSFEAIAKVEGNGTISKKITYQYIDVNAKSFSKNSYLYYRLVQVDFDGKTVNSDIAIVNFNEKQELKISSFPNPFSQKFTLSFDSGIVGKGEIEVWDLSGKTILKKGFEINNSMSHMEISDLENINIGIYLLKCSFNGEVSVIRLIKSKN